MTDTTTTTDVAIEETLLPGGGRGVVLENRDILNPSIASLKSVARLGPGDYARALQWLERERQRERDRLAAADEAMAETRAQIVADAELRTKQREALKAERPWAYD
jgi:hypothetical protein